MTAPVLEILAPLRAAVAGNSSITAKLGTYLGSPAIFTRRPAPEDAPDPCIIIGPMVTRNEQDGVNDFRPIVTVDIAVYGEVDRDFRDVDEIGELLHQTFHRVRDSITVTNYTVMQIRATGPYPAPGDTNDTVARRITLSIELYATGS